MADQNCSCVKLPKGSSTLNESGDFKKRGDLHRQHLETSILCGPILSNTATLPLITPLAVTQRGNMILVTVSIPSEAIITLPRRALEVKRVSKKLFLTQNRLLRAPAPILRDMPKDNPKLFLSGFVRKDIQYSQALNQTNDTVDGDIRDFVVDIPISGVVDLGSGLCLPTLHFDNENEYENARRERFDQSGFPDKERLLSPDFTEFNLVSNKLLNLQPTSELVFSQITEIDDELDRLSLPGGPLTEATFTTLQEKMVIVVQILLTFSTLGETIHPKKKSKSIAQIIACHLLDKCRIKWIRRR